MRLSAECRAEGTRLHVVLTGHGRLPPVLHLGVVLDGAFCGEVTAARARRGARHEASLDFPAGRLCARLDLVGREDGAPVLAAPVDISGLQTLRVVRAAAAEGRLVGRFATRGVAGPLWIECLAGERVVASGLATGDGDARDFALPFRALLPPGPAALALRVGGRLLALPEIAVEAAELGHVGFVDHARPGVIAGWALDLTGAATRAAVELVVDGEVRERVVADEYREDLRNTGISDGHSGFRFVLPPGAAFAAAREVSVRIAGTALELCNSPLLALPPPSVRGSFDRLHGMSAHGWALDDLDPKTPVVVEAVCDGEVLARAEAKLFRGDLLDAGLNEGFCAFKIDVGARLLELLGRDIHVRVAGTDFVLPGSPRVATQNPNLLRYLRPLRGLRPEVLPRLVRSLDRRVGQAGLSIIMPVYNTPERWLAEAINSVRAQWCTHWELLCIDDGSTAAHVKPMLAAAAKVDPRIRVLDTRGNVGIASASNFGLRAARGDYVTFMDHDDLLEPDAVYHLLRAATGTGADFVYSDEATTEENIGSVAEVKARPAFSYDYYLSHPYFVHMLCVRRELAHRIGGWDAGMAISADVDFVLRILGAAKRIAHVPRVLYRWRTHGGSTGHAKMEAVMGATRGALQRHLDAHAPGATAHDGVWFNQFRIDWPAAEGEILIVIPTKNRGELVRTAVESIERTAGDAPYRIVVVDHDSDEAESRAYFASLEGRHTVMPYSGPFNYSRINNEAVRRHGGEARFVLFLNNDVEAIDEGWLDRLRRIAARPEVGAVGALLLYPDRRVQHAGVIMGFNGSADHAFKFEDAWLDDKGRRNLGYNCSLTSLRDFSAVTAACMMMRRDVFEGLGGFDETFGVGFNDTDICLRVREAGLKVLYDGHTMLYHYESATRSQTKQIMHPEDTERLLTRHAAILRDGDPFYNPNLAVVAQDHVLREDPGCKRGYVRVTDLDAMPHALVSWRTLADVAEVAAAPPSSQGTRTAARPAKRRR